MRDSYVPVLILMTLAVLVPVSLVVVSRLLGPTLDLADKLEPYESGVPPIGSVREGLSVKFYRTAVLFLLFDVEVAFLIPWAIVYREKLPDWGAPFLIGELLIFLLVLMGGYVYAWRRGALEWD